MKAPNTVKLTAAIRVYDEAAQKLASATTNALEAANGIALVLKPAFDKSQPFDSEVTRLVKVACDTAEAIHEGLAHERNFKQYLRWSLSALVAPLTVVEVKKADAKNSAVTKQAKHCTTARELAQSYKAIRATKGETDGRAANVGRNTVDPDAALIARVMERWCEDVSFMSKLREAMKGENYQITLRRTKIKPTAPKQTAPVVTRMAG